MSRAMSVLCIQNVWSSVVGNTKIIPRSGSSDRRYMSPRVRDASSLAISTRTIHGPRAVSKRTAPWDNAGPFSTAASPWQAAMQRRPVTMRRMRGRLSHCERMQYQVEPSWPKSCWYRSGLSRVRMMSRYCWFSASCVHASPDGHVAPSPLHGCEQ